MRRSIGATVATLTLGGHYVEHHETCICRRSGDLRAGGFRGRRGPRPIPPDRRAGRAPAEEQYRERLSRRAVGGSPRAEVRFLSELRSRRAFGFRAAQAILVEGS